MVVWWGEGVFVGSLRSMPKWSNERVKKMERGVLRSLVLLTNFIEEGGGCYRRRACKKSGREEKGFFLLFANVGSTLGGYSGGAVQK